MATPHNPHDATNPTTTTSIPRRTSGPTLSTRAARVFNLTPSENRAWELAFARHLQAGRTEIEADALTWPELVAQFPRLKTLDTPRTIFQTH